MGTGAEGGEGGGSGRAGVRGLESPRRLAGAYFDGGERVG